MKKRLTTLFYLLLVSFAAIAQGTTISTSSDKNGIVIGEPFVLIVKATTPTGKTLLFPSIDSIAHFEIINKSKPDSLVDKNGISIEQRITLTSWDSGEWPIPALVTGKAKSKPLFLTVSFAPFNAQQPYHDIKEIIEVQKPPESKWWWYLLGIVFIVALFLLFFPKGKKKDKAQFVSEETAYKKALKKLATLKGGAIVSNQLYYTELIDILREYLLKRKNIPSWSKTSEDLVKQMADLQLPDELKTELLAALQHSDLAKFAMLNASAAENESALQTILNTITEIENNKHAV